MVVSYVYTIVGENNQGVTLILYVKEYMRGIIVLVPSHFQMRHIL